MAEVVLVPAEGGNNPCFINNWAHKEGDIVDLGDMLCEAETDKCVLDILATAAGTILKILYHNGEEAPVLKPIAIIGKPGEDISSLLSELKTSERQDSGCVPVDESHKVHSAAETENPYTFVEKRESHVSSEADDGVLISPRARRFARENGIDYADVHGTGYLGSIVEKDLITLKEKNVGEKEERVVREPNDKDFEIYELTRIERISSKRLADAGRTYVQSTMCIQTEADTLKQLHAKLKANRNLLDGTAVTLNDLILFAVSRVLVKHPRLNSTVLNENQLVRHKHANLGMATATDKGLIVPVIPKADTMSLLHLSQYANDLVQRAREGKIRPQELENGTISISNLGASGITVFSPIINPPQVCILGIGGIRPGVVADETGFRFGWTLDISLTHSQYVDGNPCAAFMKELAETIKNIDLLVLT